MSDLAASFGDVAEAYERGRPRYEPNVIAVIGEAIGGRRVLDVGAGTGRLAAPLLQAGYDVVAVEPLDAMRAILAGHIGAGRALAGRAEALPLDDASVDGAVCSDAWHWFDGPRAAGELARVVRPGGGVVICTSRPRWSSEGDAPAWWRELERLHATLPKQDHPVFSRTDPARPAPPAGLTGHAAFDGPSHHDEPFVHHTDRERIGAHWASMSFVATLPPAERERVLRELDALLARHGIDRVDIPCVAELWIARRRAQRGA